MPRLSWIMLLAVAACEPGGTVRARVVDAVDDRYQLAVVDIATLDDLSEVRGTAGTLKLAAELDFGLLSVEPVDTAAARAAVVHDTEAPDLAYVLAGDVVVPTDFDALAILTTYYHLERATEFFAAIGHVSARPPPEVYYHARATGALAEVLPATDNTLYYPFLDAFFVQPMLVLGDVPLQMNPGVVVHESQHRVLNEVLFGDAFVDLLVDPSGGWRFDDCPSVDQACPSMNLLTATDEGLADFMAAAATGAPDFIDPSVPEEFLPFGGRDLSEPRQLPSAWAGGLEPSAGDRFYPYAAGTVLASTLWDAGRTIGQAEVAAAVVQALAGLHTRLLAQLDDTGRLHMELWYVPEELLAVLDGAAAVQAMCAALAFGFPDHTFEDCP